METNEEKKEAGEEASLLLSCKGRVKQVTCKGQGSTAELMSMAAFLLCTLAEQLNAGGLSPLEILEGIYGAAEAALDREAREAQEHGN